MGIEPVAPGRIARPVDPEQVQRTGTDAVDRHVPRVARAVQSRVERDLDRGPLVGGVVEQQQRDRGRVTAEGREADPPRVRDRAEGQRPARGRGQVAGVPAGHADEGATPYSRSRRS